MTTGPYCTHTTCTIKGSGGGIIQLSTSIACDKDLTIGKQCGRMAGAPFTHTTSSSECSTVRIIQLRTGKRGAARVPPCDKDLPIGKQRRRMTGTSCSHTTCSSKRARSRLIKLPTGKTGATKRPPCNKDLSIGKQRRCMQGTRYI